MKVLTLIALLLAGTVTHAQTYPNKPIRLVVPFAPVSLLAIVPAIFVVHESVPAKDLREFVALAKKEQERWSKVVRAAKIKSDWMVQSENEWDVIA